MVIIAIDPGTKCGWCVMNTTSGYLLSGTWDLKPGRFASAGMRWVTLRKCLADLNEAYPDVSVVAFEEVRKHMGTDAAHLYGGAVAVIQEFCENLNIPYVGIPVGTVKKVATGKGNANKEDMLQAANGRWPGQGFIDDNEVDARWIAIACQEAYSDGK